MIGIGTGEGIYSESRIGSMRSRIGIEGMESGIGDQGSRRSRTVRCSSSISESQGSFDNGRSGFEVQGSAGVLGISRGRGDLGIRGFWVLGSRGSREVVRISGFADRAARDRGDLGFRDLGAEFMQLTFRSWFSGTVARFIGGQERGAGDS